MIGPKTTIIFTTPPLTGVEVSNGVVGGAGGEVANTIAGGELPMDGKGAMPPRAWDEDSVEVIRVATVGKGVNFDKEVGDDLVCKEACTTSEF